LSLLEVIYWYTQFIETGYQWLQVAQVVGDDSSQIPLGCRKGHERDYQKYYPSNVVHDSAVKNVLCKVREVHLEHHEPIPVSVGHHLGGPESKTQTDRPARNFPLLTIGPRPISARRVNCRTGRTASSRRPCPKSPEIGEWHLIGRR